MSEWMVTTSSAVVLDDSILRMWLKGHTVEQTAAAKMPEIQPAVPLRVLRSYITSQYRTYEMMHHYLHHPRHFAGQFMFPLSPEAIRHLITRYYSFDEAVIRELLGKKLSSRTRKDLDEFDNLKRIMKKVEDAEGRPLVTDIEHKFLLPHDLACQYAQILFMANNKIDTSRKRLQCYQFKDFEYCSAVLMEYWTPKHTIDTLPDFDQQLAQDIRDLKSHLLNDRAVLDDFRMRISQLLSRSSQHHPPVLERIQSQFKVILRHMLSIGAMITQPKEVRSIFVELAEKLVDAFIAVGWSPTDMQLFFGALISEFSQLTSLTARFRERYEPSWTRLVKGIQFTSIRLYRSPNPQSLLSRSFTR
ncbi:hypothetical protein DFQ27_001652 [Actinomortierella ambigua]|uniref:Acidic fibroblast growth factor binding protein n=1 Tax=Actinomortierella ambigua TaxID=1343610 RepID=A0A9P6Q9J3_9FUNG|nr:hypothetical protein DFQ27_001652 [Actinomortierella ambigua]